MLIPKQIIYLYGWKQKLKCTLYMYIRLNGELLYECTTKFLPNSTGKPVQCNYLEQLVLIKLHALKYKTRRSYLRDITGMTLWTLISSFDFTLSYDNKKTIEDLIINIYFFI